MTTMLDRGDEFGWHPLIVSAVIRIATNPKIYPLPCSLEEVLAFLNAVHNAAQTVQLTEGPLFWQTFENLIRKYKIVGPPVTDAYYAALAVANDATLISSDRGFSRMEELRWRKF